MKIILKFNITGKKGFLQRKSGVLTAPGAGDGYCHRMLSMV
jgi:hypothetical protein